MFFNENRFCMIHFVQIGLLKYVQFFFYFGVKYDMNMLLLMRFIHSSVVCFLVFVRFWFSHLDSGSFRSDFSWNCAFQSFCL